MTTVYNANITTACTIFCEGPVLHAIQMSGIFPDSKTFVDMPMRFDPDVTLQAFNSLTDQNNKTVLEKYLEEYFLPMGSDLDDWVPTDFTHSPPFLETITDADMKQWGSDLNELWLVLGRQVNVSVHENPQRHSFVTRNYPMIVPGGRFRESYYWDSWWIIRGLLVCDMDNTAKDVINNLLDDLNTFGFIPNGGRIYYLDRSQPPLMSEMLRTYYSYMSENTGVTADLQSFISSAFESIVKEYNFWMSDVNNQMVEISTGPSSTPTKFNRYYSNYTTPRPESYLVDVENAEASGRPLGEYYQQVRAGAESGWDFSSRWIRPSGEQRYNLTNIHTNEIVPVELNSIMYRFELNLEYFATLLSQWATQQGNTASSATYTSQATLYSNAAAARMAAINTLLWDAQHKHWRDFNLTSQQWTHYTAEDAEYITLPATATATAADPATSPYATIAYWIPMWAGISPTDGTTNDQLVSSLQASGLLQVAGVLTTTVATGQQWDSPEAWAPLVMFTIEGLQNLNTKNSLSLAVSLMRKIISQYEAYRIFPRLDLAAFFFNMSIKWSFICHFLN